MKHCFLKSPYDIFSVMNYEETEGYKLKEKFRSKYEEIGIYPLTKQMVIL